MNISIPTGSKLKEAGFISITVALVFMMVISLTVLGFSQVSRRNNRQALDRQLSSQADYAAETAVNDVMNKIAKLVETSEEIPQQTECSDTTKYTVDEGRINTGGDDSVMYTCLLVTTELDTLTYSNVGEGSLVVPLSSENPEINVQELRWKRSTEADSRTRVNQCPNISTNLKPSQWVSKCPFGVLRVDIIPINTETVKNADNAQRATMTMYIYPKRGGGIPNIGYSATDTNVFGTGAPQGLVREASCTEDECGVNITNLAFQKAYMRVSSLYLQTPSFQTSFETGNSCKDCQVEIDVTARAQDVVRRIKARLSITGGSSRLDTNGKSDYGLTTTDSICKRFSTAPNYAANDSRYPCT